METIKCKRIEVVNDSGDLIISLAGDHFGKEPEIRMYSSDGTESVVLFTREKGGAGISILSKTGQIKASIFSDETSHGIVVYDDQGDLVYDAIWPESPVEESSAPKE